MIGFSSSFTPPLLFKAGLALLFLFISLVINEYMPAGVDY